MFPNRAAYSLHRGGKASRKRHEEQEQQDRKSPLDTTRRYSTQAVHREPIGRLDAELRRRESMPRTMSIGEFIKEILEDLRPKSSRKVVGERQQHEPTAAEWTQIHEYYSDSE